MTTADANDSLAWVRNRFSLPKGVIYLDANSLGPLPRSTAPRIATAVRQEWGDSLIGAWNDHDWINLPRRAARALGPLLGADSDDIAVADSTTVNLFKCLTAALRLRPDREVVVVEQDTFPTDAYVAAGVVDVLGRGHIVQRVPASDMADEISAAGARLAAVVLSHVDYRSGRRHDLAGVTAAAHAVGALTVWDLAHSAGVMPLHLERDGVDFAVGCGYKWLNGGPGAPSFLYVAQAHQEQFHPGLVGWMGHAEPFDFDSEYQPARGAARAMVGTPPILSLIGLIEGLASLDGVDLDTVRRKSVKLTESMMDLVDARLARYGFGLATPRDPECRGGQVSLVHPDAYAICQALIARGVIGDFRTPDILRFGLSPLFLRHSDIPAAIDVLHDIMATRAWDHPDFSTKAAVT